MINTKITFDDKAKEFIARNAVAGDAAFAFMAQDIEILVKTGGATPFRKGGLRNQTYHEKMAPQHYQVTIPVEYAEAQEAGIIHGSPVQHYTTPGTGPHFFQNAINKITEKVLDYVAQGNKTAGIE